MEQIESEVLMLEHVHGLQWVLQEITEQYADSPTVHADEDRLLFRLRHDVVNRGLHPFHHVFWTFSTMDLEMCVAQAPLLEHVMVVCIFLRRDRMTLLRSPTDFIQARKCLMRNAPLNELLDRLLAPFQSGGINHVERDAFIAFVEQGGLRSAEIIQISIDAASLNDIAEVEIRLAMTYEVDFFTDQFLHYFVAASAAEPTSSHPLPAEACNGMRAEAKRACPPELATACARKRSGQK